MSLIYGIDIEDVRDNTGYFNYDEFYEDVLDYGDI